jgi:hypothetical protein
VSGKRIVVVGTVASDPYAGMAWMHMQIVVGLRRLGHDAYYFEITSAWPYDPVRKARVGDSDYALPYLRRVAEGFDLADYWAYRRSYSDNAWFGMNQSKAEQLLADADAVLNVAGATRFSKEQLKVGRLIYFGTDPGHDEISVAEGDERVTKYVAEHDEFVTYGENIGTPHSSLPPLPGLSARTRQAVLLDCWQSGAPSKREFTTVANWKQTGRDIEFRGEVYRWSKHHEFLKFIDVPRRVADPIELATGFDSLGEEDRQTLESNGWRLVDAHPFTVDPFDYQSYVRASRGELTVAKDLNVRLRTGWFSERSACYLAAGRPVITQDTGFGTCIPTGEGLFAFNTCEEVLAAFEAIASDYERHSRAARLIAEEYFRAETVLAGLLRDLGL